MGDVRCSARPSALVDYGRAASSASADLAAELQRFDHSMRICVLAVGGVWPFLSYEDGLWSAVHELADLATWVGHVGWAFAVAGAAGDATAERRVVADATVVDHWLEPNDWAPGRHVRPGAPGEWLRALDGRCRGFTDAGYRGRGFIVGPDGRTYPLVAPFVVRDGHEYQADDDLQPGAPSVLDLDGRDPGWTTIDEQIGIERWRDAPDTWARVWSAIGSTVGGRPNGSDRRDVEALVIVPGKAPTFGPADVTATEPSPPPYMEPVAPEFAPPNQPDTAYPGNAASAAAAGGAPMFIEALGGGVLADQGSYAGYDIAFQQNDDGRVRALYKRVYVGFGDDGRPYADSVWIVGPERSDQVLITYSP